jgi:RNA polymerase sigma-70 factor (ECF subfamily)
MEALDQLQNKPEDPVETTEALVVRARRGDAEAFARLIRRYERVALSVAFGVLGKGDAAGDVVQETFLRAWQRLSELKTPAHFATWICGIARNLAIDQRRRGKHSKLAADVGEIDLLAEGAGQWSENPLEELDRREQHALVAKALDSLDEVTRPIVTLRYYNDLSSKEIAQLLQLSPAAVDMRLSRARQQLRKILEKVSVA